MLLIFVRFLKELKRKSGLFSDEGDGLVRRRTRLTSNTSALSGRRGPHSHADMSVDPNENRCLQNHVDDEINLSSMRNPLATGPSQVLPDMHGRRRASPLCHYAREY